VKAFTGTIDKSTCSLSFKCTFGLSQKYQKDKATEGMTAKATHEIIRATQAVRGELEVLIQLIC
jgi:hypothetical protein